MVCKMQFPDFSKDVLRQFVDDAFETRDHDLMCFLYCIGHEMTYMDELGNFMIDNIIMHRPPLITENQIREKMNKCQNNQLQITGDICEKAFKRINCFFTGELPLD